MIIYILILCGIILLSVSPKINGEILSVETTRCINGIFVVLIFLSHSVQYVDVGTGILNKSYMILRSAHNQLVVTSFLTFSGYGVMEQILKRGGDYLKSFPRKRILKTIINFDVAIILYLIISYLINNKVYSFTHILLSMIGWKAVGNSNWYIFSILLLYAFTWISWKLRKNYVEIPYLVTLLSILYTCMMYYGKQPERFMSTILCYSLGMFISYYKDVVRNNIKLQNVVIVAILFLISTLFRHNVFMMNIHSVLFMLIIIYLTTIISIHNKVLNALGKYAFNIYILQRIPMEFFSKLNIEWYLFVPICFISTLSISYLYGKIIGKLDNLAHLF